MISYIYIDEDDNIGTGRVYEDDIGLARQEIIENIRQATDSLYICITSRKIDFVEESKEYEDIHEYYFKLIEGGEVTNGNDNSTSMGDNDAGLVL